MATEAMRMVQETMWILSQSGEGLSEGGQCLVGSALLDILRLLLTP